MTTDNCVVCNAPLRAGRQAWHWRCAECGYEKANLKAAINNQAHESTLDESARALALSSLRIENFKQLLTEIKALQPAGRKLLDVGCAHGWFLDEASPYFDVLGIEPDHQVGAAAASVQRPIRLGYFPEALNPEEKFDVIVFNDVIEHIPSIDMVLDECHRRLNAKGMLVLNLPSSRGLFYRLAVLFNSLGLPAPFERMWQVGLPSPHVHYFDSANLVTLLEQQGFAVRKTGHLASVHLRGLYKRLSFTKGNQSVVKNVLLYLAICCALPFIRVLPSDIIYVIAEPIQQSSKL
jgi:2-polyprenyl-3-methyl-5-hydroxy-6-metoxy-1,4-benzoquinol methylase